MDDHRAPRDWRDLRPLFLASATAVTAIALVGVAGLFI